MKRGTNGAAAASATNDLRPHDQRQTYQICQDDLRRRLRRPHHTHAGRSLPARRVTPDANGGGAPVGQPLVFEAGKTVPQFSSSGRSPRLWHRCASEAGSTGSSSSLFPPVLNYEHARFTRELLHLRTFQEMRRVTVAYGSFQI